MPEVIENSNSFCKREILKVSVEMSFQFMIHVDKTIFFENKSGLCSFARYSVDMESGNFYCIESPVQCSKYIFIMFCRTEQDVEG